MSKKPATYGCEKCQAKYRMGDETTIWLYSSQPWFDHIETVCPGCKITYYIFELSPATIEYMANHNMVEGDAVRFVQNKFAQEAIWRLYCKHTGKPFPEEPKMSPRMEKHIDAEVAFFGYLLERGEDVEAS